MGGWRKPPEPAPDPDEIDVCVEVDPEHEWRMEMLQASGFTEFQAFRLSVGGADWHDAKKLLDRGCRPEDVIDILT